jgi:hypothetical protein
MSPVEKPIPTPSSSATNAAMGGLLAAYKIEIILFVSCFLVFAFFSGPRFWRQSAAPHFVYQAQAFLEGHTNVDVEVLPNIEDWACVRNVAGKSVRCEGQPASSDTWYSSFPWFPSVVMAPFVFVHSYQFNDTSFGVFIGALAIALFYALLRKIDSVDGLGDDELNRAGWAALMGIGSVYFYAAIRGEVWFSAEIMGVAFTALYLRNAVKANRPFLAGLFWSMAVLTRTPLFFTGIFFLLESLAPLKDDRLAQLKKALAVPGESFKKLQPFILGAAPLGVIAAIFNFKRFGSFTEFGHRFFFNNRVNADIDNFGLFHPSYLLRNLEAAFLRLPSFVNKELHYDAWGLSLFITLPVIALAIVSSSQSKKALSVLAVMVGLLIFSGIFPPLPPPPAEMTPVGFRNSSLWLLLFVSLGFFIFTAFKTATESTAHRLMVPTLVTLLATALPGLFYQNTGYAQFGFRFSIDYAPYVFMAVVLAGWNWRKSLPLGVAAVSVAAGVWGAVAFRGYTEMVLRFP